ncbi:MAG: DNA-formamidopyrimidine glycosylase [Anaerorhabdus sp.]|uniref:DNA-formamidopyrimidine glycosylase n=1 Tax=Anaerorhabdus sp. TaxID=1872524 RepID=UPI002FC87657
MPELPEVETVVRTLEHQIKNQEITDVEVLWNRIIASDLDEFKTRIIGQHFREFKRRGKYLIFVLDDYILISHLRMEGKFFHEEKMKDTNKHMHVIFTLGSGKQLRYHDTRKFGRMELVPLDYDLVHFKGLGPEPWDEEFNKEYCYSELKKRSGPIKGALLDQSFVAGVGNIYADEICFAIGVDPRKSCKKMTKKNAEDLVEATKTILEHAISLGGTTIRSYTSSLGVTGRFQLEVKVHGKEHERCPRCNNEIKKIRVATRGTYYCPHCQKR